MTTLQKELTECRLLFSIALERLQRLEAWVAAGHSTPPSGGTSIGYAAPMDAGTNASIGTNPPIDLTAEESMRLNKGIDTSAGTSIGRDARIDLPAAPSIPGLQPKDESAGTSIPNDIPIDPAAPQPSPDERMQAFRRSMRMGPLKGTSLRTRKAAAIVLLHLRAAAGARVPQTHLAGLVGMKPRSMVVHINALVRRGLLVRGPGHQRYTLTPLALSLMAAQQL